MEIILGPLVNVLLMALSLLIWVLIIWVIMSWLINFQIINPYQTFVNVVFSTLERILNPLLRPIRNFIPPVSGIDFSPLILIFLIYFLQGVLQNIYIKLLY